MATAAAHLVLRGRVTTIIAEREHHASEQEKAAKERGKSGRQLERKVRSSQILRVVFDEVQVGTLDHVELELVLALLEREGVRPRNVVLKAGPVGLRCHQRLHDTSEEHEDAAASRRVDIERNGSGQSVLSVCVLEERVVDTRVCGKNTREKGKERRELELGCSEICATGERRWRRVRLGAAAAGVARVAAHIRSAGAAWGRRGRTNDCESGRHYEVHWIHPRNRHVRLAFAGHGDALRCAVLCCAVLCCAVLCCAAIPVLQLVRA